jgi:hypothetical protein
MLIEKYTDFFHDGAIREVQNINGKLQLSMESAELIPEWNEDNIFLSKRATICGKLFLEGIKTIKEDDCSLLEEFKVKESYKRATILDFEIKHNLILLVVFWAKHLPKYEESQIYKYEIEAEKIYWENIPTLFD